MFSIPYFDLNTDQGKQQFVSYIVNLIRKEIISYSPSYITSAASGGDYVYQNTDFIQFNTNLLQAITPNVGQLNWNDTSGTLEFGLKGGNVVLEIGQEQVALVKHADNTGLDKGKAVYVVGSDGANKTVRYAQANTEATSSKTFGIMAESVTGGDKAFVATHGIVSDIDTSALTEGAAVWLSPSVAGGLTTTKPSAPNHLVLMGFCVRSHATVGKIFVHVVNGFELDELHNVKITSPVDEEVIRYDAAQGLWVNGEAGGSIDVSDSAPVGPATGDLWYNSSNGRTYIRYDSFWVEIGNTGDATSSHASTHITGASDVIDGDRLNISYVPSWYTRNSAASGAADVQDLTAHLSGIDAKLGQYIISSTAPSSPTVGWLWFDTVNGLLRIWNGSTWRPFVATTAATGASSYTGTPLQIAKHRWTNETVASSGTYIDATGSSYTFKPLYASSRLEVVAELAMAPYWPGGSYAGMSSRVVRDGTVLTYQNQTHQVYVSPSIDLYSRTVMSWQGAANNTNNTTFKIQLASYGATNNARLNQNGNWESFITITEWAI